MNVRKLGGRFVGQVFCLLAPWTSLKFLRGKVLVNLLLAQFFELLGGPKPLYTTTWSFSSHPHKQVARGHFGQPPQPRSFTIATFHYQNTNVNVNVRRTMVVKLRLAYFPKCYTKLGMRGKRPSSCIQRLWPAS